MTNEERTSAVDLLSKVPLFAGCEAPDLAQLAASASAMTFEPADVLCEEGAESPECYVVAEGEAVVTVAGKVVALRGPHRGRRRTGADRGPPAYGDGHGPHSTSCVRDPARGARRRDGRQRHSSGRMRYELRRRYG